MSPKILRRCDLCQGFHASYLVPDAQFGKLYLCYRCWKAKYGAQPSSKQDQDTDYPDEEVAPAEAL